MYMVIIFQEAGVDFLRDFATGCLLLIRLFPLVEWENCVHLRMVDMAVSWTRPYSDSIVWWSALM